MACILSHSNKGSRKTRLIYKCNLSLSQFKLYSECLIKGNLLKKYSIENKIEIYETTEKGKNFLEDYDKISKVLNEMRI